MSCIVTRSTQRFFLYASKDGAVWNITGATVTLVLTDPLGVVTTKTATISDAANGVAYYETLVTDITLAGSWLRRWRVVQSPLDITSLPVAFEATANA